MLDELLGELKVVELAEEKAKQKLAELKATYASELKRLGDEVKKHSGEKSKIRQQILDASSDLYDESDKKTKKVHPFVTLKETPKVVFGDHGVVLTWVSENLANALTYDSSILGNYTKDNKDTVPENVAKVEASRSILISKKYKE